MGLVSPTQSSSGDTIEAADINDPINQLAAVINGSIETANLADSAVTTVKLANASVTPAKWTNPYCFRAYAGATTTMTDGSLTKVAFNTESYDYNNNFASSSYTVPVAGVYHFDFCFALGTVASMVRAFCSIYVDTVETVRGPGVVVPSAAGVAISADMLLDAGDVIEFYGFQDSAGNEDTTTGSLNTYVSGHLVHAT